VKIAVVILCLLASSGCEENILSANQSRAMVMCKQEVRKRLKAPATADFPTFMNSELKDGKYVVTSYVDAQNGFGANLRTYFQCETGDAGAEQLEIAKVEFSKD
jgi:hypothetical protein